MELDPYQRSDGEREYRNGFYERDYVTRFGTIRLRIARTGLFTLSSSASTSTGKTAPSSFLHKQLDITRQLFSLDCTANKW